MEPKDLLEYACKAQKNAKAQSSPGDAMAVGALGG